MVIHRYFIFMIFMYYSISCQFSLADELCLNNGDKITGQLIYFSTELCTFETPYQATLHVKPHNISQLITTRPVMVELVSGELFSGKLKSNENNMVSLSSQRFGTLSLDRKEIIEIIGSDTPPTAMKLSELTKIQGKGDALPEQSPSENKTTTTLGQEPEEDLRQIFLRESTVLLKPGEKELDISLNYKRDEYYNRRSRQFDMPLSLRLGLTNRLEGFLSIPVIWAEHETVEQNAADKNSEFGIGDITAGLKYVLKRENEQWPDIIGFLDVSAPTGENPDYNDAQTIALGSGQWNISTGLSLVKSYDPAVIFGNIGYAHAFENTLSGVSVEQGDTLNYDFGMGFAINNQVSVSSRFLGAYQFETEFDGIKHPDSTREPMSLRGGLTFRLAKDQYLEPAVTFGINNDADDATVNLSYTRKF